MKTLLTCLAVSFIVLGVCLTLTAWAAPQPRQSERDLDAVPQTYDECVASGTVANCNDYPDAPRNKPRIWSEVRNYKDCVISGLAIDCAGLPGAPQKHRHAATHLNE